MKKLTALDSLFLTTESSQAPTHAGILQIFDLPPKAGVSYVDRVYETFLKAQPVAPWNCYPDLNSLGGGRWRPAEDFDGNYHVRRIAVPAPGSDGQLMTLVGHLYPGLLDRRLPLWECYIIDGLQDNRFAIFYKVHHAYGDGMSGARALFDTLNEKARAAAITPLWTYERLAKTPTMPTQDSPSATLRESFSGISRQLSSLSVLGRDVLKTGVQVLGLSSRDSSLPFSAPNNSLNQAFHSGARNFAYGSISLEEVKIIARQHGATVNDVVMTICDHAMVQYLKNKDEAPQRALTGMMAVSTRKKGDQSTSNAAATALTGLGEPGADIVTRLQQISRNTGELKESLGDKTPESLFLSSVLLTLAPRVAARVPLFGDKLAPTSNLFVSNIPGMSDKPRYLGSARMSGVYTAPIVQAGIPLNITLGSYNKQLCFGFGAASEVMPDATRYAALCFQAFEELASKALGESLDNEPRRSRRKRSRSAEAPDSNKARRGRKAVAETGPCQEKAAA
jgi:WS/DGAT/MGAT family acyltransferase